MSLNQKNEPKLANRQRGWKAKRLGSQFEVLFYNACARDHDMGISQILQGGKQISARVFKRMPTEFDFTVTYQGVTAFIDTKGFNNDHMIPSYVERHQVNGIVKHIKAGARGGYVVNLRKIDRVIFFPGQKLVECFDGFNLLPEHGIDLGSSYEMNPRRIFTEPIAPCNYPNQSWQVFGLPTRII